MFAKMVLASGCTLQQLRDDLVAVLTGTIASAAGLTACTVASSEVVKTINPEWTFVQHLSDTATRCHFVLSGVDDGGITKTLGILMTDTSGTLAITAWACGPWNSTTKRPAAYDVTGLRLGTSYSTAAAFAEGNVVNCVTVFGAGSPTAMAVYNTGTMQLLIGSVQGSTVVSFHYGTSHVVAIDMVDVRRSGGGDLLSGANHPFPLVHVRSTLALAGTETTMNIGPVLAANSTTDGNNGVIMPCGSGVVIDATGYIGADSGITRYRPSNGTRQGTHMPTVSRATAKLASWCYDAQGDLGYVSPCPTLTLGAPFHDVGIPGRASAYIVPAGSTTAGYMGYLDELVVGGESYVSIGETVNTLGRAFAIYKG